MVRNYKRKTDRGRWEEDDMRKAVRAVISEKMGFLRASSTYNVPKSTLERRVRKARCAEDADTDSDNDYGKKKLERYKTVFTKEQEEELSQYIKSMEARLFGITGKELRILAFQLAEKNHIKNPFNVETGMAGEDWLSGFNENDCPCIYCGYLYSQSTEGWVVCGVCHSWAHNSCAGVDDEDDEAHICDHCQPN